MLQTFSLLIMGKVQGVFYRQSTKQKALELGLKGIVRNLSDGSVEIIATGTKEQIDQLAVWCQQGPPKAKVISVEIHELPLKSFTSFSIDR